MRKRIDFESEFILHTLTQKHLKELFNLEFIASEIQLDNLRLDNLAFDRKTNSFVIIEYKNEFNANVLNQAQDYYDLIQDNREFFSERLSDDATVDFDNVRIMVIGPEFSQNQIDEAKATYELWKVSLFDDGEVTYENLNNNEVETLNINLDELKITEEMLLDGKSSEMTELYFNLKDNILNDFSDVEIRYLVDQFSLRADGKLLCLVRFLKSSFAIYIYADSLKNADRTTDISQSQTGGRAKYQLKYESDEDYDYFIDLFKQTYSEKVEK